MPMNYNWIKAYFHKYPASITEEAVYDVHGRLVQADTSEFQVYPNGINSYHMLMDSSCLFCCGCISLCQMLFDIPAMLLFPWILAMIGTFLGPICLYWYYNVASSAFCLVVVVYTVIGVFQIQKYYKDEYPGTLNVQVDVKALTKYFYWNRFVFLSIVIGYVLLFGTGFYLITAQCKDCGTNCGRSPFFTVVWLIVHFMTIVNLSIATARFFFKYSVLVKPPVYEDVQVTLPEYPPVQLPSC